MEEISSFLALTPCGIFQSPSSTGVRRFPLRFFQKKKRKDLLFINIVLYSTTPIPMRFFETPAEGRRSSRTAGTAACFLRGRCTELQATLNNNKEL
ncbi:MAG: hypothetical protein EA344_12755 [Alkalicoccus sp.]|nr:MAG: hypothetical protein EA344_12755 [Alkalicoccus sp.]